MGIFRMLRDLISAGTELTGTLRELNAGIRQSSGLDATGPQMLPAAPEQPPESDGADDAPNARQRRKK